MTGCRSEELDGLLAGELSGHDAALLEGHLRSCASCAHEMKWLRAERALFEQRARREAPPRRAEKRKVVGLAAGLLAASVALAVVGGQVEQQRRDVGDPWLGGASVDPQLTIATLEHRYGACLVATPGEVRPCGTAVLATFP